MDWNTHFLAFSFPWRHGGGLPYFPGDSSNIFSNNFPPTEETWERVWDWGKPDICAHPSLCSQFCLGAGKARAHILRLSVNRSSDHITWEHLSSLCSSFIAWHWVENSAWSFPGYLQCRREGPKNTFFFFLSRWKVNLPTNMPHFPFGDLWWLEEELS